MAHEQRGPPAVRPGRLLVHQAGGGHDAPVRLPVRTQGERQHASLSSAALAHGHAAGAAESAGGSGADRAAGHGRRVVRGPGPELWRRLCDQPDRVGLAEAGAGLGGREHRGRVRVRWRAVRRAGAGPVRREGLRGVRERAGPAPVPGVPEVRAGQLRGDACAPAAPPVRDRRAPPADGPDGHALDAGGVGHLHRDAGARPAAGPHEHAGGLPALAGGPVPVLHVPGQGQQRRVLLDPHGDHQQRPAVWPGRHRVHVRRREQRGHQRRRRADHLVDGHQRVHAPAGPVPPVRARGLPPDPHVPGLLPFLLCA